MKRLQSIGLFLILVSAAFAGVQQKKLIEYFDKRLIGLMDQEAWTAYVKSNPRIFPTLNKGRPVSVAVQREIIEIGGETIKLGVSYLQVYAEAPFEKFRALLEDSRCYRSLYDLDKDAFRELPREDGTFEAHIYKRIPVLHDQDYILSFKGFACGPFWFQRASLVEDKKNFALRDNLKMLEPVAGGTVFREIGILYPLKWTVRAMWPTLRDITRKELYKMGRRLKCAAETSTLWNEENALDCQRKKSGL